MHGADGRKDDKCVPISVRGSEVIKIDLVPSLEQFHSILKRAIRETILVGWIFEHVHLLHVRLCIFLRDDLNGSGEKLITSRMVSVGMCIDDVRDGFARHRLDLVENRLTIVCQLSIDQYNSFARDKYRAVPACAWNHVQPVRNFLNRTNRTERSTASASLTTALTCSPTGIGAATCFLCDETHRHQRQSNAHDQYQ